MAVMLAASIASRVLYSCYRQEILFTLYVTMLTFFYHFAMRVVVGETITILFKNREFHYNWAWYKQHKSEKIFYKIIRVKRWKLKLITAKPEQFDIKNRTYQELIHNMTQAEVVHEIIMVLSFVPVLFCILYGAAGVFISTSLLACLLDFLFVIIQRYNRPRVLALKERLERCNI